MTTSQELLLSSITTYYEKHADHRNILEKIVLGDYKISLRVIDWFITHYSKQKTVLYWIDTSSSIRTSLVEKPSQFHAHLKKFHLYLEYRAQLKSYTKMFFDPFRRHARISFLISKKPMRVIETTIGQLNFFRWVFQNHILEYIETYQEQIEEEMAKFQTQKKEKDKEKEKEAPTEKNKTKTVRSVDKSVPHTCLESQCYLRFD